MAQSPLSSTEQLKAFIAESNNEFFNEQEVITEVYLELFSIKKSVGKQEVIFALINRLEIETDEDKSEFYRKALKIVVLTQPEEWSKR